MNPKIITNPNLKIERIGNGELLQYFSKCGISNILYYWAQEKIGKA